MLGSIQIARLFGIDIRIHWSFFLLFLLPGFGGGATGILILLVVFCAVLLHELGHSLVAKAHGVRVVDITFWPLGGMARMAEIPERPRVEMLIAVAGPAVNFLLAGLTAVPFALAAAAGSEVLLGPLGGFILINLFMGGFNLLPCFPMDGGRILRAFLARGRDYVTATEMAVRTGRVVTVILLLGGLVLAPLFNVSLCVLPLIAAFVWYAGGKELLAVRIRHGWNPFAAAGGFPGAEQAPGSREAGRQAGPFTGFSSAPGARAEAPWSEAGWDGPRAAQDGRGGTGGTGRSGFSEREIEELERFRGRLRKPPRGSSASGGDDL